MRNFKIVLMMLSVIFISSNLYAVKNLGFNKLTHQKALFLVEDLRDENPVLHRNTTQCPSCGQYGLKVTSYLIAGNINWADRYVCVAICRNCNKLVITDMIYGNYVDGHPEYKSNGNGICSKELYNGKYK